MDVQHHQDPRTFLAVAEDFYKADTLRHTVALTVMTRFLPMDRPLKPHMASLHDGATGSVIGVAFRTPPWAIITSGLPADAGLLDTFVAQWLERDPELPGAVGPRENAEAFAAAWARRTGGDFRETTASRLYRLGDLVPPTTSGAGRPATESDVELLVRWRADFTVEAHGRVRDPSDGPTEVRRLFELGYSVIIWEDGGVPVAMAMATTPIGGMARVGPVYTPPEHRERGYGSAVTAAASRSAQLAGARDVILFTDLANPVSNSIYQKIGYRPVYDSTELEFTRLRSTP